MTLIKHLICLFTALAGLTAAALPVAAAAQTIDNTATLNFKRNGAPESVPSNTTRLSLSAARSLSPTMLKFYRMPANFDYSTLSCVAGPPRGIHGAEISAAQLATMTEDDATTEHSLGIVLWNAMGNKDPAVRETQTVQGSTSTGAQANLILTETGPDTGVFAGGFSSKAKTSRAQACLPVFPEGTRFFIRFAGDADSMPSEDDILIDPFGHVFDSVTGLPVNGATITLIDNATGLPAIVFGDDGVTPYPSTVISGQNVTDSGGNVYEYGDGDYRFPLTRPGNYHLQIIPPSGYLAPSTVAPADLAPGPAGPYDVSDASYGAPFPLFSPEPLEVNIPVDPLGAGMLGLEKTTSVREASAGDLIPYNLTASNAETRPIYGAIITDTLPRGLSYKKGTTNGAPEPVISADGRTLTFRLGAIAPGGTLALRYVVTVNPSAPEGQATNRAVLSVSSVPAAPEASVGVRITPLLFTGAMTVIGRVVQGDCDSTQEWQGVPGVRLLMEDGTYVVTDRNGLYHFEGVRPGRHVVQIDKNSLGTAFEPVLCQDDTRFAGNPLSRFVEGTGGSLHRVDFRLKATGEAVTVTETLPITVVASDIAAGGRTDWLLGQKPGIAWLFPDENHNPRAPALRVVVKHAPDQRVALTVNGQVTDPLAFDGMDKTGNSPKDVAVSIWTGLGLKDGQNRIEARVLDASGKVVATLTRDVTYANTPVDIDYVAAKSRLIADGRTHPLIAVRLTDKDGQPVRHGTTVAFRLDAPYLAAQTLDLQQSRQLAGLERAQTTVSVTGDDGLAFIALAPTTQAGQVRITFDLPQDMTTRTHEVRAFLEAGAQDWVVVGFGAGTLGYDTLSKNSRRFWLPQRRLEADGQLSLYAKGRIKGAWLMTLSYDSERRFDPANGLLAGIDPDQYYTVYGDATRQAKDAPSARKLYLRLERKTAYVMFGDFETALTETRLTRYSRTLNGFKAGYNNDRVSVSGFAARSDQRYARDEIQGNGLSGPYRLSAGGLVPHSDKVSLEVRDRFRPEKIISTTSLTRHIDYDIDPEAGTLRFRSPVLSRDADLNPVFIVVDYEVTGTGDQRVVAGGRVGVKLADDRVEVGVSGIRDDAQNKASVIGVDLKAEISETLDMRVEAAKGGEQNAGENTAYLVELEHNGPRGNLIAYVRHQDEGFGVGQQNFSESGTHKLGLDGQARLNDQVTLSGALWRQESTTGPHQRVAGDVRLNYRRNSDSTLFVSATGAVDEGLDAAAGAAKQTSRLLTLGGTQAFMDGRLQTSGQVQFALGDAKSNAQFPVRHALNAAYKISDSVRLIAGHEIAKGDDLNANTTRIGFDLSPWQGLKLSTTLNQRAIGENGTRSFAQFGLSQSVPVGNRWTVDMTLDASRTLSGDLSDDVTDPFLPQTTGTALNSDGQGDFTSATLGATYRAEAWSWNGRIEARHSSRSDRRGITSNILRSLGEGKTVASSLRFYDVHDHQGKTASLGSWDVSLAWRPLDSRWSVLERLELRRNRADAGVIGAAGLGVPLSTSENQQTTRLINNLAFNFRSDLREGRGVEASLYYGAKKIEGRLSDDPYDGFIDTIGFEVRKSLGPRFDLAFALSRQHAHDTGATAMSYGPSLGYSPKKDMWVSVGYNIAGYHDPDSERYTRKGAYVTVRIKFDQDGIASGLKRMF